MQREVVLISGRHFAEALSDALLEAGALSATVEDADAGTSVEQPLFGEPGADPAQTAWERSRILALFDEEADWQAAVAVALEATGAVMDAPPLCRDVADEDWVRITQAQFQPMSIGDKLFIVPTWHELPEGARDNPQAVVIRLDPGMAFGTGSHPTTRLCLRWLEQHMKTNASVIDYGCGSGILGIAAKKLGAGRVTGTDIDEQAILAAQDNSAANGADVQWLAATHFSASTHGPADIVLANILANPLRLLAPVLSDLTDDGGWLVLSGILERQAEELRSIYASKIDLEIWATDEGWVCLAGRKAPTQ